jgi:hypothetical protein
MRISTKEETKYMPIKCASQRTTLLEVTVLDQARKILSTVNRKPLVWVNTRMPTKANEENSEIKRILIYKKNINQQPLR